MSNEKKNILLVGQGCCSFCTGKKLKSYDGVGEIYAAPGNCIESDIFKNIDIREDDLTGLLKFALENDIDLTIPVTDKAIKTDIVSFFQSNGQKYFLVHLLMLRILHLIKLQEKDFYIKSMHKLLNSEFLINYSRLKTI